MKRLLLVLGFLTLSVGAVAKPLEVASFAGATSTTAQVGYLISASPVSDESLGFEVSFEKALGLQNGLRFFVESRQTAMYNDPRAHRVGGGLAFRHYWYSDLSLAGMFLELHGSVFNVNVPDWYWDVQYLGLSNYTVYGGGAMFGWQIPLSRNIRLTPAYRLDWHFQDELALRDYVPGGRIRGDLLLYLGYAF